MVAPDGPEVGSLAALLDLAGTRAVVIRTDLPPLE